MWIPIFQTLNHFFCYLGVLSQNAPFIKKILFARGIFWDQSWLEQTPPTGFLDFFLIYQIFVFNICIYSGNWGVEGAVCKILELWGQHPRRNNLSKSATFQPILQRPHSAMGGQVDFFSPWWKWVLGACFGPKWPPIAPLEHPKEVLSFTKEA